MANHYIAVLDKARGEDLIARGELEVGRGTAADLTGIFPGDRVAIYCPRLSRLAADFVQEFAGVGRVRGAMPHAVEIHPGVVRARLFVDYATIAGPASIRPLLGELSVTKRLGRRWGPALRRDLVGITEDDFHAIASAVGAVPPI